MPESDWAEHGAHVHRNADKRASIEPERSMTQGEDLI